MKKLFTMLYVCLLAFTLIAGQPSMGFAATTALPSLRVQVTPPETLDTQKSSFANEIGVLRQIYEGLTRLDSSVQTVPGAAQSWAYDATASQLVFTLRSGLTYSDGSMLNAKRFEYSLLRLLDPGTNAGYASIIDEVVGAIEYRSANPASTPEQLAALRAAVGIKALDSADAPCTNYSQNNCTKLRIQFVRPTPYFHTVMAKWFVFPAKEELITSGGINWWQNPANQLGNGPFSLDTLNTQSASFKPNNLYWGKKPLYNMLYTFTTNSAQALIDYKNDLYDIIGASDMSVINNDPTLKAQLSTTTSSCSYGIMFHQQQAPFTDQKVREAFAQAIDRSAFINNINGGLGQPTLQWYPKGLPAYVASETRWGFDAAKAQQALADSSYHTVQNLPVIKATFATSPRNLVRWQWFVDAWKNVLGVTVELEPLSSADYSARVSNPTTQPQFYLLGWCEDYPDPINWMQYWRSSSFSARFGYSNPALEALLDQADSNPNPTTRMGLYQQAQTLLIDGAPAAFLWNSTNNFLVKPRVHGMKPTLEDSNWPGELSPFSISIGDFSVFLPSVKR